MNRRSLLQISRCKHAFALRALNRCCLMLLMAGLLAVAMDLQGEGEPADKKTVRILWKSGGHDGSLEIVGGRLEQLATCMGTGTAKGDKFKFDQDGAAGLEARVGAARLLPGPGGARVIVRDLTNSFCFFLRDVRSEYPIYIPEYAVVVTVAEDPRDYLAIERALRQRHQTTLLDRFEDEAEENWQSAASHTRQIRLPIWMGVSRDTRLFELDTQNNQLLTDQLKTDRISARFFGDDARGLPFMLGKGVNAAETMTRHLDEGCLPILHGVRNQEGIEYTLLAFVSLESSPLTMEHVRGTHFLVSDYQCGGNSRDALTPEQLKLAQELLPGETSPDLEQTVLYFRARARNTTAAPHYAYFLAPDPNIPLDAHRGFFLKEEHVAAIATLNGRPLPNLELSVLLFPGEEATLECRLPHSALSVGRAERLAVKDFDLVLDQCRRFWKQKLGEGTQIQVPDPQINNMLRAGLLHLDLVCFGREPAGPVAAATGYAPIGTESAPIIQFLDSMGRHELAGRALVYFLEKQHADGFMQNYKGYQAEVGPVLWSIGEHWRLTRDQQWARSVVPRVLKSCAYLLQRRQAGKASPHARGYGMIRGKVGDPEDPFQSFMLNGYACLGLSRIAEMLQEIDPSQAGALEREAQAFRQDIRESLFAALSEAPAVPLGDGSWAPCPGPWVDQAGALILYSAPEQRHYFTHGSLLVRDSLVGPIYLPFTEVLSCQEPAARWLAQLHSEMYGVRNVVPTQPYYSRHPWLQLKLGYVRSFLKAYYNAATSAFDRETFTVKEHAYGGTVHKTHEEAWFLMQTRWMLWMEEGKELQLLAGVPRAWLKNGQEIRIDNAATYFGPLSLHVDSRVSQGLITAEIKCDGTRAPKAVVLRLPHPDGQRAISATGGRYEPQTETIRVEPFSGEARVELRFERK
jgi:hypothetical protein